MHDKAQVQKADGRGDSIDKVGPIMEYRVQQIVNTRLKCQKQETVEEIVKDSLHFDLIPNNGESRVKRHPNSHLNKANGQNHFSFDKQSMDF